MKFQIVTASYVCLTSAILVLPAYADPLEDLETCKSIVAEAERLACFEAGYDQLRAAGMTADSVLKANVPETEVPMVEEKTVGSRGRFDFFGRKNSKDNISEDVPAVPPLTAEESKSLSPSVERDDSGKVSGITSTVVEVHKNALEHTTVTLSNGQKWRTSESRGRIKPGAIVNIRRTRLGGYFLSQGGGAALRVKRVDKGTRVLPSISQVADGSASVEKKESLFSKLNPFGRKTREVPAVETRENDPDFGGLGPANRSEETFGQTRTSKNQRDSEQKTLTQTVSSVLVGPFDKFIVTLGNGQVWRQTEGRLRIREGDSIFIKKSGTGSHFLQKGGKGPAVRVKRVS